MINKISICPDCLNRLRKHCALTPIIYLTLCKYQCKNKDVFYESRNLFGQKSIEILEKEGFIKTFEGEGKIRIRVKMIGYKIIEEIDLKRHVFCICQDSL